jgi:catechol 2,3-dioxygenase-like lactoylglutathione lyase family enzyme
MMTITAPVSRALPVSDPARAAAFYRDVLGFELHGSELSSAAPRA